MLYPRVLRDTARAAGSQLPDFSDPVAGIIAASQIDYETRWAVHPDDFAWIRERHEADPEGTEQWLRASQHFYEADPDAGSFADAVAFRRRHQF